MKIHKVRTREHKTSYHNGLMGETQYQNDPDNHIYPNDESMYDDYKDLCIEVTEYFLNNPVQDYYKQWCSPSFTDCEPHTGKKYMIRGKTFRRHYDEFERERSSDQYRVLLNNPNYTCGKTWTIQEMILYLLQVLKLKEMNMRAPFHEAGIKRINRMIEHLRKWRPHAFGHLDNYKVKIQKD
jgi:hypothetical protein